MKLDLFDNRDVNQGNKLRTLREFKCNIKQEDYLSYVKNVNVRKNITKLRLSAHNLPIEKGRYKRPEKIPPHLRLCDECNTNMIGDEFHIIMKCNKYEQIRADFFEKMNNSEESFSNLECHEKFVYIMKLNNENKIDFFFVIY